MAGVIALAYVGSFRTETFSRLLLSRRIYCCNLGKWKYFFRRIPSTNRSLTVQNRWSATHGYALIAPVPSGVLRDCLPKVLTRFTSIHGSILHTIHPPEAVRLHALYSHVRKGILVSAVRRIVEEDETHFIETIVLYEELLYRIERDDRRLRNRITVHAGADRREGNRLDAVLQCES